MLFLLNYATILIYGIILSISFCNLSILKNKYKLLGLLISLGFIQFIASLAFGQHFIIITYPLLVHLPVFLILIFYFKKKFLTALNAILSGYLFCIPRRFIGTLVSSLFGYSQEISFIAQLLITLPLLLFILHFISPRIAKLETDDYSVHYLFTLLPATYYIFSYTTTVYSRLLYSASPAIIDSVVTAFILIYYLLSIMLLNLLDKKNKLELEQEILKHISEQSLQQVSALKHSQEQAAIYRHDMRHYLQYIYTCISEGHLKEAQDYILKTGHEIETSKVTTYCANETLNLIFSSYAAKAQHHLINYQIHAKITDLDATLTLDLCSLLSNALENAINACIQLEDPKDRWIKLTSHQKNNRLFIEIANSSPHSARFSGHIPVTTQKGHGFGVKSILSIINKYHGTYQFTYDNEVFSLKAVL